MNDDLKPHQQPPPPPPPPPPPQHQVAARHVLLNLLGEDSKTIAYRPRFARMAGGVTSGILLQQVFHHWLHAGGMAFYKFLEPCQHHWYRPGDSWTERLEFTAEEFTTAIRRIGTKITRGTPKGPVLEQQTPLFDGRGRLTNAQALVLYWTDSSRVTWYDLNSTLFAGAVLASYGVHDLNRDSRFTYNTDFPGLPAEPTFPVYDLNRDSRFTSSAETDYREGTERRGRGSSRAAADPAAAAPSASPTKPGKQPRPPAPDRGTRITEDWQPTDEQIAWARDNFPQVDVRRAVERFRDYWCSVAGAKGRKVNWNATWRNWVREDADRTDRQNSRPAGAGAGRGPHPPRRPHRPTADEAADTTRRTLDQLALEGDDF